MIISSQKGVSYGGNSLISETMLAHRWGKSIRTLQRMRKGGGGPPFVKIGHSTFYLAADIAEF